MKKNKIGIVDYGIGNYASLSNTLSELGYIVNISHNKAILSKSDILILPGVGAFPKAMQAIKKYKLAEFLQGHAKDNKPLIGICLGMQLLATSSSEIIETQGLGIIPGKVSQLEEFTWHIGWNNFKVLNRNKLNLKLQKEFFYFNHSYVFNGNKKYIYATSNFKKEFPSIIGINNVLGIQFHPEKSQAQGKNFLKNIIKSLVNA
jgi:imidazole glycerol-phosphate synthase subunit HisH